MGYNSTGIPCTRTWIFVRTADCFAGNFPEPLGFDLLPKSYIYFFRGTPLLVQMFMIYHGMGQFELVRESVIWIVFKEAYWCALIAFALNTAGYTAEILRGTIEQTPYGEIEAARACGMSKSTLYRRIILPGTFRRALPAYGNEVIFMLHGSALAGVVTIVDLFGAAKIVNSRHFVPFESFITAGFFYLCLTFIIVSLFKKLEFRWYAHTCVPEHPDEFTEVWIILTSF